MFEYFYFKQITLFTNGSNNIHWRVDNLVAPEPVNLQSIFRSSLSKSCIRFGFFCFLYIHLVLYFSGFTSRLTTIQSLFKFLISRLCFFLLCALSLKRIWAICTTLFEKFNFYATHSLKTLFWEYEYGYFERGGGWYWSQSILFRDMSRYLF